MGGPAWKVGETMRRVFIPLLPLLLLGCWPGAQPEGPSPSAAGPGAPSTALIDESHSATDPLAVVIDTSSTMTLTDFGPGPRIDAARDAVVHIARSHPNTPLTVVGASAQVNDSEDHAERGCSDAQPIWPQNIPASDELQSALAGLQFGGWSTLRPALYEASGSSDTPRQLLLLADGRDDCGSPTLCEAAKSIAEQGNRISVVALRTTEPDLECVATAAGGFFTTADNREQLIARARAAVDPPRAASLLSPSGYQNVGIGMEITGIQDRHPSFPQLDASAEPAQLDGKTLQVVQWRDASWYFDGPTLKAISTKDLPTIDGYRAGNPVLDAERFLGAPVARQDSTQGATLLYPANLSGLSWRLTVDDDRITDIMLCDCGLPGTDGLTLSFRGIGGLRFGQRNLEELGAIQRIDDPCRTFTSSERYQRAGVSLALADEENGDHRLTEITLLADEGETSVARTYAGAAAGMTFREIRTRHPEIQFEVKEGNGGRFSVASIRSGSQEMAFLRDWRADDPEGVPFHDDDMIRTITVREHSPWMFGDC